MPGDLEGRHPLGAAGVGVGRIQRIETEQKLSPEEAREILKKAPGIVVKDEPVDGGYPTPWEASETFETFVGRIREDFSHPKGLTFWVVADQLYKGAALNSIQIAEVLATG